MFRYYNIYLNISLCGICIGFINLHYIIPISLRIASESIILSKCTKDIKGKIMKIEYLRLELELRDPKDSAMFQSNYKSK